MRWRAWKGGHILLKGHWAGKVITSAPGGTSPPAPTPETAIIVSKLGSNTTGLGTLEAPYRSLAYASGAARPGDTIYLRGGYYDVVGTDTYVTLSIRGTNSAPINISSYPGEWAILDGINHSNHPRSFEDGNPDTTPYVVTSACAWVNWSNLEERNGQGGGWLDTSIDCTFDNMVFRNNNAHGLMIRGRRNDIGYCLFRDTWNVVQGGNGSDGCVFVTDTGTTMSGLWPDEPSHACEFNRLHHSVSNLTSDDGFTLASSVNCVMEYCIAMYAGYVPEGAPPTTGMGTGFKMGLLSTVDSGNIVRYCMAIGNLGRGYNNNTSQVITVHNCLSFEDQGGFTLVTFGTPDKGANTAHNNLVVDLAGDLVRRVSQTQTTHTHNAGSTDEWANGDLGTDNIGLTALELAFVSKDPTHANFAKLGAGSLARGHGTVIENSTDVDLGPIPRDTEFAGGWDWRALLAAHPSVREWPMPQT